MSTSPHVYAGKIQKGSYHNPHKTLLYACLYRDDMRRKRGSKQLKTETNLVDIDVCRDDWCVYDGGDATPKKEWGPNGNLRMELAQTFAPYLYFDLKYFINMS